MQSFSYCNPPICWSTLPPPEIAPLARPVAGTVSPNGVRGDHDAAGVTRRALPPSGLRGYLAPASTQCACYVRDWTYKSATRRLARNGVAGIVRPSPAVPQPGCRGAMFVLPPPRSAMRRAVHLLPPPSSSPGSVQRSENHYRGGKGSGILGALESYAAPDKADLSMRQYIFMPPQGVGAGREQAHNERALLGA